MPTYAYDTVKEKKWRSELVIKSSIHLSGQTMNYNGITVRRGKSASWSLDMETEVLHINMQNHAKILPGGSRDQLGSRHHSLEWEETPHQINQPQYSTNSLIFLSIFSKNKVCASGQGEPSSQNKTYAKALIYSGRMVGARSWWAWCDRLRWLNLQFQTRICNLSGRGVYRLPLQQNKKKHKV